MCKTFHLLLEEGQSHPIVRFTYLCHVISKETVFVFFWCYKLDILPHNHASV